ncbi:uncharacterized protein LOC108683095 [Hyalella azteca]|uniref:Uncharacterized protein LOC108683095 n=1 Tax=Hyalella azteca TaxID=294128 RepID=A0A8B7PQW3_HYAAZ|nr:uncharacterized protein LOC108683095 [Hyalella azteca]
MSFSSESEPLLSQDEVNSEEKRGLCLLRPYRLQDEMAVKELISEATMETVGEFFWAAILSEIFPQISFIALAVGFVGFSLPFYYCLALIPAAVALIYVFIWSAHLFKTLELHSDLSNIANVYQKEPDTGFWVAEVYDNTLSSELSAHFNITKKVLYDFITEEDLDRKGINLAEYKHRNVVGCVGLTHSNNTQLGNARKAWLRRFAVKKEYRRRGIASNLLEFVIAVTRRHNYKNLELITTHCHHQAREMYMKAGFSVMMNTRHYLNVPQPTYHFSLPIKPSDTTIKKNE